MRLLTILAAVALIAGCGFKGPLYLPAKDKPVPPKPPAAKPAAPTETPVVPQ